MHLATGPEMVAAVANAGGLGILYTTGYETSGELRDGLRKVKSLTDRPFGANINLFPGTRPTDVDRFIETLHAEGVRVIETSGRSPKNHVARIKDAGSIFMHKVARVRDGVTAARLGADAIEIVGYESGGHPGEDDISLMIQTQLLVREVEVPVVPAGGVVDGHGLLVMLALGAEGVCMGTRFMAAKECLIHDNVKDWILKALAGDTVIVERSLGNSMRVARTSEALRLLDLEKDGASLEELLSIAGGAQGRKALMAGELATTGLVCVGETAGLINDVPTVRELIERTIEEAEALLGRLCSLVRQA